DGTEFIASVLKAAEELKDYTFECQIVTYGKGNKATREGGRFWYKDPGLMRVEVTEGSKKGAEAVLGPDGRIRGHLGGFLKKFVTTLSKDSHFLRSANNYSMLDSDYVTLMKSLKRQLDSGARCQVTSQAVSTNSSKSYVVEVREGSGADTRVTQRIFINPESKLPETWILYRNGSVYSITSWRNVRCNVGLTLDVFNLKHQA
ncbi:MAG TPA: hypothetical protein V6D17_08300, partial [Candidatus Obscuribacterales bacterium]